MKKLLKIVNVELRPPGDAVILCMYDYTPDIEQVDPKREKFALLKQQFEAAGMKEVGNMLEALGGLADVFPAESAPHPSHHETAKILITAKEYEEMGRPTVGQLIETTMERGKEEPPLKEEPKKVKPVRPQDLNSKQLVKGAMDVVKDLEGPERKSIERKALKDKLAQFYGEEVAEKQIRALFREGLIYETKPGFVRRLGA